MINEKKIPDEIQPAKPNWRRRLLISALKSPISTILILAFLYFAFQAYVLQLSPTVNKFYMFGVLFLWVFWYVAKNVFKVILLAVAIAYGAYTYHTYSTGEIARCELSGGTWNEEIGKCEEKTGFWAGMAHARQRANEKGWRRGPWRLRRPNAGMPVPRAHPSVESAA